VTDKEKRSMRIALGIAVAVVGICGPVHADEARTAAKDFWKVFVQGDLAAIREQYADEIVLKAGSEFLKKEWGINESDDRTKDKKVSRDDLMKAYSAMLAKIGTEKWNKVFGDITEDKITPKTLENKHVVLTVRTGPGNDQIEFELGLNKDKTKWLVVSEMTDY
jgi:hypothetical protein